MGRVVVISSVHPTYDTRVYHNEAVSLVRGRHEVTLLIGAEHDEVTAEGVRIRALPVWKGRLHRLWVDVLCLFQALRLKGDVYHFHDPELLPCAFVLAKVLHRCCIYDAHEYYAEAILFKPWIPARFRPQVARFTDRVEKWLASCLSGVITVNDEMKQRFLKVNPRVESVYNFPQLEYFSGFLEVTRGRTSEPKVLYLGAIGHERGLETLIEGVDRLVQICPEAKCIVVGQIERDEVDPAAIHRLEQLVAAGAVHLTGQVPFESAVDWLGKVDVAWLPWRPSPNNELGIPRKLLEYMAAGLPVVASDFGFISNIIRDADCGALVPAEQPIAHASAIHALFQDPNRAAKLGVHGRQAFLDRYNWHSEERKLLEFYDRVLAPTDNRGSTN